MDNLALTMSEVQLVWGKSRRQVDWAIWTDKVVARQALGQRSWLVRYDSCVKCWGQPLRNDLIEMIRLDWNE